MKRTQTMTDIFAEITHDDELPTSSFEWQLIERLVGGERTPIPYYNCHGTEDTYEAALIAAAKGMADYWTELSHGAALWLVPIRGN